jgi:hypothetical protein
VSRQRTPRIVVVLLCFSLFLLIAFLLFRLGLATVYFINAVLAGLVAFQAPERGQPLALWITKTFAIGGLAYDQFMQLPTLDEIEKEKAVKGRRALKNKKK